MSWYTGDPVYDTILFCGFCLVLGTLAAAPIMQSPYGRFGSNRFGITLDPRIGWFLMELPATLTFLWFYFSGPRWDETVPLIFMGVWLIHYTYRGFIFPSLMRVYPGSRKSFSILVVAIGWIVTTMHGYFNGSYFSTYGDQYLNQWLLEPRFIAGIVIYYTGFAVIIHSDSVIRNLRSREKGAGQAARYSIPDGGLFRYVSNPQYLGELMAWTGFAVFTWSLGGVFILAISAANLLPRAFATHRWYLENFSGYPADRKVLIPFVL